MSVVVKGRTYLADGEITPGCFGCVSPEVYLGPQGHVYGEYREDAFWGGWPCLKCGEVAVDVAELERPGRCDVDHEWTGCPDEASRSPATVLPQ